MKATLHKLIGTAVLSVALFSNSLPAWAGAATRNEVYINSGRTNVQGSLTGARYSADSEQYLGCESHDSSTAVLVYCFAWDNRGRFFACRSTDPRIADAVKGMTDSSHLNITAFKSGSEYVCSDLTVDNASLYLR